MAGYNCRALVLLLWPVIITLVVGVVVDANSTNYSWNQLLQISDIDFQQIFLPNYLNDLINVERKNDRGGSNNSDFIDRKCGQDLRYILNQMIHERKLWATKIFNSWSQSLVPSGFISGTITDYGDYDQCLSIDKIKSSPIIPEYCLLEFEWPMPTKQPFVNNHNVNHRTNGIIPSNVDDRIIVNKTIYTHLANESSIFYYSSIIRGICLPNSCTKPNELLHNNIEIFGFKLRQISCNRKPEWPLKPNTVQLIAM